MELYLTVADQLNEIDAAAIANDQNELEFLQGRATIQAALAQGIAAKSSWQQVASYAQEALHRVQADRAQLPGGEA